MNLIHLEEQYPGSRKIVLVQSMLRGVRKISHPTIMPLGLVKPRNHGAQPSVRLDVHQIDGDVDRTEPDLAVCLVVRLQEGMLGNERESFIRRI